MSLNKILGRFLIVDDDQEMREMTTEFLTRSGYAVKSFSSGESAFAHFGSEVDDGFSIAELDAVISDINMPGMDGMELVARMKKQDEDLPVILITAFGSIESAIEATRRGAFDYIAKPFKLNELLVTVQRAQTFRNLKRENEKLKQEVHLHTKKHGIIGQSRGMRQIFELVNRVAGASANVMITGESGTGKELIARAIHDCGPRANKPFVAINCAAIPGNLLESELFGHAKGAFTGAIQQRKGLFKEAEGGTIFLDEIGDMEMSLQAKLLRAIQERSIRAVGDNATRPINVRIICATHRDLKNSIKSGDFREDLYYRLSVVPIHIPPLRERREDIPLLAHYFLKKYSEANKSPAHSFAPEAMRKLCSASWEGNVRELENVIERIVVLTGKAIVESNDVPFEVESRTEDIVHQAGEELPTIEELEKRYIALILKKTGGRKEIASQILGINRRTLYRKEREYGFVAETTEKKEEEV